MQFYGCFAPAVTGPPERWRNLPPDWPHWQAVYYYFDRWKAKGTFEQMNAALNQLNRVNAGREAYPSALCIDSQSVKLSPLINSYRGTDPHKRVNGRKRTFIVDTQGRLWLVDVDAANQADGPLAKQLIVSILWRVGERLEKIFGDQAASAVRLQRGVCP
jgi:transposase